MPHPITDYKALTTKTAKIDFIRGKMQDNVPWAVRACATIYKFQTAEEQNMGHTHDSNGVGFSGVDSEILSSFAEQINKGRKLTTRQLPVLFKLMPKYAGQLYRIAENKQ